MIKSAIILLMCIFSTALHAQYHAPAEEEGTHAIHMDSSVIVDWATSCVLQRGWRNITDTTLGKPIVGDEMSAIGKALENGVVSLGDGGMATLSFAGKIYNGPGPDFAVFENGFDAHFLELAFVEVSSDGANFYRFPAHSLTNDSIQLGGFDSLDARNLNNLAGKYQQAYGVPFDLEELKDSTGLDVEHITHLRVVDVVGTIDPQFASLDKEGNKINDPFPTPFISGGFDLDAVGVMHLRPASLNEKQLKTLKVFPNPAKQQIFIDCNAPIEQLDIYSFQGNLVRSMTLPNSPLSVHDLTKGIYVLRVLTNGRWHSIQLLKQ